MGSVNYIALATLTWVLALLIQSPHGWAVDPTSGFTELVLDPSILLLEKPYNLSTDQRYSFINGVHKLWVYSTDAPHIQNSPTKPRTEITIAGFYDYSWGVWQFEGYGYVPAGTSGVCIMQISVADPPYNSTLLLNVYDGTLTYFTAPAILSDIYDRWFRLNVIHDVSASQVTIYVDGEMVFQAPGRGGAAHNFQFGVYAQDDDSNYMESSWKDIKIFQKE